MVVRIAVLMFVVGCVADADDKASTITVMPTIHASPILAEVVQPPDVCAEAANLPADDICALLCDPDALEAELLAQGVHTGTCYELRCSLPQGAVSVGVCLPPGT